MFSRPPTAKSMACVDSSVPPNQRRLAVGSAHAVKTCSGGASKVRSMVKVAWVTDLWGIADSFDVA